MNVSLRPGVPAQVRAVLRTPPGTLFSVSCPQLNTAVLLSGGADGAVQSLTLSSLPDVLLCLAALFWSPSCTCVAGGRSLGL